LEELISYSGSSNCSDIKSYIEHAAINWADEKEYIEHAAIKCADEK
jgi:hypothetical protein